MTPIQIAYLIGAPAAIGMPFYYHFTNKWYLSKEGRVFMLMMLLPFGLYLSTVLFLLIEKNEARDVIRFCIVTFVSIGSWATVWVYRNMRQEVLGKRKRSRKV